MFPFVVVSLFLVKNGFSQESLTNVFWKIFGWSKNLYKNPFMNSKSYNFLDKNELTGLCEGKMC